MNQIIYGDYHTHTVFSHGKGTIMENVARAAECGLKEIAITDHGFRHMAYNVRRSDFAQMRALVNEARDAYPDMTVYLGLETNITSISGEIDIKPTDMPRLDILLCGYHRLVLPRNPLSIAQYYIPALWSYIIKRTSPRRKIKNTDAYVNAIVKNPIDILTHLNYGIVADPVEVAKAAAQHGTFIELNGKHIDMTDGEIEQMLATGVKFIANSDAHSPDRIGDYQRQIDTINRVPIPPEQIANLSSKPQFRSQQHKTSPK